ncbi:MAG TPA: DUF4296 domain-containing protein [Pelobium sp.]|nr:DUF4296 domain-containing protein [Pelobium sp.]
MKRLILLIAIVLFYVGCLQDNLPNGLIEKDKMINVMLDMQLTDAILNQVYNNDTMKMHAHSRFNYIFKKYEIDSAAFTNSLKYYSKDPTELDSMYTLVSDSLIRLQEILAPKPDRLDYSNGTLQRNLSAYVLKNFTTDSAKFTNIKPYNLDVKELYERYNQRSDSLSIKDSLKLKQVEEIKKATKITNDLSAE